MTMIRKLLAVAVTGFAILTSPGFAESRPPDNADGRYSFNKVAEGYVRLDSQTGQVSLCNRRAVGWACQAVPEDRAVLENEIARLRSENAVLKKDLLSRGLPLPTGSLPEPPLARNDDGNLRLPNNADIDRMMTFVGKMWRRLVDMITNAHKDTFGKG
jgi:hypothetical protein